MFKSSGYFHGIYCPFYVNGLCERPFCHYRHSRLEEKNTNKPTDKAPSYSSSRIFQPGSVLQTSTYGQKDVASHPSESVEAAGSIQKDGAKDDPSSASASIPSFTESPQSLPEPVGSSSQIELLPPVSGLSKPKPKPKSKQAPASNSEQPSYVPTPKRFQLIFKGAAPSYKPTPKHESSTVKTSSHVVEYDPVKNFAFREKTNPQGESDDQDLANEDSQSTANGISATDGLRNEDGDTAKFEEPTSAGLDDDLTDSDEDVSHKYANSDVVSHRCPQDLSPFLEQLLTPSSYFTSKLLTSDKKSSPRSDSLLEKDSKEVVGSSSNCLSSVSVLGKTNSDSSTSSINAISAKYRKKSSEGSEIKSVSRSSVPVREPASESCQRQEKPQNSSTSVSDSSSKPHALKVVKDEEHKATIQAKHGHTRQDSGSSGKNDSSKSSSSQYVAKDSSGKISNSKTISTHAQKQSHSHHAHKHKSHKHSHTQHAVKDKHLHTEHAHKDKNSRKEHAHNDKIHKHSHSSSHKSSQRKHSHRDKVSVSVSQLSSDSRSAQGEKNNTSVPCKGDTTARTVDLVQQQHDSNSCEYPIRENASKLLPHSTPSHRVSDNGSSKDISGKSLPTAVFKKSEKSKDNKHSSEQHTKKLSSPDHHKHVKTHQSEVLRDSLDSNLKAPSSQDVDIRTNSGKKKSKHKTQASSSSSWQVQTSKPSSKTVEPNTGSVLNGLTNGHSSGYKEAKAQLPDSTLKHKHGRDYQVSSGSEAVKLESIAGITPIKEESNSSTVESNVRRQSQNKEVDLKHERRVSSDSRNNDKRIAKQECLDNNNKRRKSHNVEPARRNSSEQCEAVRKRRISDITTSIFGNDSENSEYDSDIQIVEPPPPTIYELSDNSDDVKDEEEEETMDFSDLDDLDHNNTLEECLRIFRETEKRLAMKGRLKAKSEPSEDGSHKVRKLPEAAENLHLALGKKRMAHRLSNEIKRPKKPSAADRPRLMSPAEVMTNRIIEMQKRALLRATKREAQEAMQKLSQHGKMPAKSSASSSSQLAETAATVVSVSKKREAHVPNLKNPSIPPTNSSTDIPVAQSTSTKLKGQEPASKPNVSSATDKLITIASTASKTQKRKAHEPTLTNLKRPILPAEFGAKVPTNVRQTYLNLIIDEYLKFNSEEVAFAKGLEGEQAVYSKSSNKKIYLIHAVNAIKKIRTEAQESQPSSSKQPCLASGAHPVQSHQATLGGSLAARTSFTLHRSSSLMRPAPQSFSGKDLYEQLKKYLLTEEQLKENGYPRQSEDGSGKIKIYKEEETDKMLKENERTCRRCGKRFYVDELGGPATMEQCVYHYANPYKKRVAGVIESRYVCCNERAGSKGCQVAKCHVHEKNKSDSLTGYMKTLPASTSSSQNYGIYALDCEMVYTKAGIELARVTVVDEDCQVKYETLVRPETEILDYNTRFSGITEADMKGTSTTLTGVQAVLLSLFHDQTILIGHSLESDLQALKLLHSTVIDTSIVFPHRLGLPYKRALRSLMVDHLQKIIQADDSGHDSKEDAVACMQLMIYKVKADAKRRT